MYTMEVDFLCKEMWKIGAENFKAAYFYNGTQSSCNDEEQNLFLAYEYFFHLMTIKLNILKCILYKD
jgi:hypothetical protein